MTQDGDTFCVLNDLNSTPNFIEIMQVSENFNILLMSSDINSFFSTNQHNVKPIDLICTKSIETNIHLVWKRLYLIVF